MVGEAFVAVAVHTAIVIFGNESPVIHQQLYLAREREKVPLREKDPKVIHDETRRPVTRGPAAVAQAKAIHGGTQPVPVLIMSVWHS